MSNTSEETKQEIIEVERPATSLNPFESERLSRNVSIATTVDSHRAIAEVQAAIMLAKQFPRDKLESMDRILTECCRPTLAESATYSYTRGGAEVTGPSIRLAEVLATNWGNFQFGWNEMARSNGQSEILAFAWDCQTNVRRTIQFFVKHWRDTKKGGHALRDERDIYEICANQAARRMRACILNTIPGDVIECAVQQCEKTLATHEIVTPETIALMIKAFEPFGVTKEHIEKRIGRKIDAINGAVMVQLRKIYNGLKDGMCKPHEFFDVPDQVPAGTASDITSLKGKAPAQKQEGKAESPKEAA